MKRLVLFFVCCMFSLVSAEKVIHVFLVGPGVVGSELLSQIHRNYSGERSPCRNPIPSGVGKAGQNSVNSLNREESPPFHGGVLQVRVVGLADSRSMCFDPKGIKLESWKSQLAASNEAMSLEDFIRRMVSLRLPQSVFVDCTSSQTVADAYRDVLGSYIPVVTPNKKANSGLFSTYAGLKHLAEQNRVKFLYDANVGAGLPLIHMIQSMRRAGDRIVRIEAILSGTLSYLSTTFNGSMPFSKVVREAQKKGYTEPDPRDDLNGMDMARKFLILAREAGLELEMADISIEPFLPDACFKAVSVSEFYKKLEEVDSSFTAYFKQAGQKGLVFRFIGTLEGGKAELSLKAVGPDHPFYHLSGTDNIAAISSEYYAKNPVVIKGPGAGARVTAASVLSNIIEAGD